MEAMGRDKEKIKDSYSYDGDGDRGLGNLGGCWDPREAGISVFFGLNTCSSTLSQYGKLDSYDHCLLNFHAAPGPVPAPLSIPSRRLVTTVGRNENMGYTACAEL